MKRNINVHIELDRYDLLYRGLLNKKRGCIIMSEQNSFKIPAHHNIYLGTANRELRIDFSEPQNGVNAETGLLILVPGFGADIDSKVYTKMREVFADQYNMVTIQCNYFGSAFMQSANNVHIKDNILQTIFTKEEIEKVKKDNLLLLNLLKGKNLVLTMEAEMNETLEEFNDMSYMQAIDIITAIEAVKVILNDNNLTYNSNRTIGYGHSHGAYLLHLSNVLAPNLFSYIVDNSAWVEPSYISNNRYVYRKIDTSTIAIEFDYLAKKIIKNKQDLNLKMLYKNYSGTTQILSFQGNNDNLVNHEVKKQIIETINNSKFILVTEKDVDNKKYKSNSHGLDADFLELFSYALEYELPQTVSSKVDWEYVINFRSVQINVDNTFVLPTFNFKFK
jgi:hypothetical protein